MANTMKTLINNVVTFFEAGVTAGTITSGTKVYKGLQTDLRQIPKTVKTYIAVDDGGERTEVDNIGSESQRHYYQIVLEFGSYSLKDKTDALDKVLDLNEEAKDVLEAQANKQLDGMTFGINITAFTVPIDEKYFWRVRQVIVEYHELEDRYATF